MERKQSSIAVVGLHAHSVAGSPFDGFGYPQEHMDYAYENGCSALALTDQGNMNGMSPQILHAKKMKLDIDYRHISAEDLLRKKPKFDVILNMEVIEHVESPAFFIEICSNLLKTRGLIFCSTINKNFKRNHFA